MKYLKCGLILLCLHPALASEEVERLKRMRGGSFAKRGQFPYQIYLNDSAGVSCGGSIIDQKYGITAAHCVTDSRGNFFKRPITVTAGVSDLNDFSEVVTDVSKAYILKDYVKSVKQPIRVADIAVIKFKLPLKFNKYVNKLELPAAKSYEGKHAIVTGFGDNYENFKFNLWKWKVEEVRGSDDKLRFGETVILHRYDCENQFMQRINFDLIMCARFIGNRLRNGLCPGDSGGPLVLTESHKSILLGVASTGSRGCNEFLVSSYYTRVSRYINFIKKAKDNSIDEKMLRVLLPTLKH